MDFKNILNTFDRLKADSSKLEKVKAEPRQRLNESVETKRATSTVKVPSLSQIFRDLMENDVSMEPVPSGSQVIKQNGDTLGTVSNPAVANQLKTAMQKGEIRFGDQEIKEAEEWIKGAIKHPGAFSAKAKKHGMSTKEFANYVLSHKNDFPSKTEKQANLAKSLGKMKEGEMPLQGPGQASPLTFESKQKDAKRDNKAEKAGKKVTKDLEYDMGHKGKDDKKAEKAGKKVTKEIEYDEWKQTKLPPMSHIKKMCKDKMTDAEILKMHPKCDKKELKDMIKKCKTTLKEGAEHILKAARHMGKAHGLNKHSYANPHDSGTTEARSYHEGYVEGLDECMGIRNEPIIGMTEEDPNEVVDTMASYGAMGEAESSPDGNVGANESVNVELGTPEHKVIIDLINGDLDAYNVMNHPRGPAQKKVAVMMQDRYNDISSEHPYYDDDFEEIFDKLVGELAADYGMAEGNAFTAKLASTPKGGEFELGGKKYKDTSAIEEDAWTFESLQNELNDLLNEGEVIKGPWTGSSLKIPKFSNPSNPNKKLANLVGAVVKKIKDSGIRLVDDPYDDIERALKAMKQNYDAKLIIQIFNHMVETGVAEELRYEVDEIDESSYVSEGKMKNIDLDMKQMSDADFKERYDGTSKADMKKELSYGKKPVKKEVTDLYQVRYLHSDSDKYKIEKGFTSRSEAEKWIKGENLRNRAEDISIEKKTPVKEGISVSVSKGQQGAPDSVSVSAQDNDADALLAMIKQAGLGLFGGDEPRGYSSYDQAPNADVTIKQKEVDVAEPSVASYYGAPEVHVEPLGSHDDMLKLLGIMDNPEMRHDSDDFEDEDSEDYEHEEESMCEGCGMAESKCGCNEGACGSEMEEGAQNPSDSGADNSENDEKGNADANMALATQQSGTPQLVKEKDDMTKLKEMMKRMLGEVGDEASEEPEQPLSQKDDPNLLTAEGAEDAPSDENQGHEEEITETETDDQREFKVAESWHDYDSTEEEKLDEWANDAGKKGTDAAFQQDIDFMTNVISGGLNKQKSTGQTTVPVIAGQKDRMGKDSIHEGKSFKDILSVFDSLTK